MVERKDPSVDRPDVRNPKGVEVRKVPDGAAEGADDMTRAGPDKASTGPKGEAGMGLGVSRGDYTQGRPEEDRRWPESPSANRSD